MSIVLTVAEGEVFVNDAEIQKSALQVIINCVCAPDKRISSIGKFIAGTPRRRQPQQTKASENVLTKMWNVVQSNNGIKVELESLSLAMNSKKKSSQKKEREKGGKETILAVKRNQPSHLCSQTVFLFTQPLNLRNSRNFEYS